MPWLSWMMKSVCCASSTRDQIGCVSAMSRAGISPSTYAMARGRRLARSRTLDRVSFGVDTENAEEEACKDRLHAKRQQDCRGNDLAHGQARVERAKSDRPPAEDGDDRADDPDQEHQNTQDKSRFELDVPKHRGVSRVGWMKSHAHRKHLREDRENDELIADQATEAREQKGVDVESERPDRLRSRFEQESGDQAGREQRNPRIEKKPTRAEEQHEPQVAPTVAPGAQVRRPRPAVRTQRHGYLVDPLALQRGLDHHLAGKLHAGRAKTEALRSVVPQCPP